MEKKPIRVFVVDDSKIARTLLTHIIEKDPALKVVGVAENGEEALKWLQHQSCDVITMDIQMPLLNGFEVTKRIMATNPTPIVIVSTIYHSKDTRMDFRALEAGALAIIEKPAGINDITFSKKAQELTDTIKMVAGIKLVKKSFASLIGVPKKTPPTILDQKTAIEAVAIGASLGGPTAICRILSELPPSFPVPIFIVQHIASGFTEGFVSWLEDRSPLHVCLAKNKEQAKPGIVYVSPDSSQMEVKKGGIIYLDNSHTKIQPTIGRLFKSMAEAYGPHGVGVILTGMGNDGAKELLLMKQEGAYTIAQDEESCTIFGIPKEAIKLGAAHQIISLDKIASVINSLAFYK